ncbi:unnamed protein product, partial [marine sediment metagenome]
TSASGSSSARHTINKPFTLTVTARNASGATCPNYNGTANLTVDYIALSTDLTGSLSTTSLTSSYWTNGIATITDQTYNKWGTVTITATDATLTTQTGTSENIVFLPKDFYIVLSEPPASRIFYYINEDFSAEVTARDYNNNTVSNYAGTVHFTGIGLNLPQDYTFLAADSGSHTFSAINGSLVIETTYISVNE